MAERERKAGGGGGKRQQHTFEVELTNLSEGPRRDVTRTC